MIATDEPFGVNLRKIPLALQQRKQWLVWKYELRDGKPTKVPYNARTGGKAQSTNPGTWAPFGIAASASRRGYEGPGFVFTADDDFVGVDLDGCRDPETGAIADWATPIIESFASYAEVSPSGSGVKIFCRGKLVIPAGEKKKWKVDAPAMGGKAAGIEIYDSGRFFCVTGLALPGAAEPQDAQAALDLLVAQQPKRAIKPRPEPCSPPTSNVARARSYVAKMPVAVEGSFGSDAAFAVACVLFRFGLDFADSESLFREYSDRCEPPWNENEIRHKLESAKATVEAASEFGKLAESEHEQPKRKRAPRRVTIQTRAKTDGGDILPDDAPSLRNEDGRTDQANARRLVAMFGDIIRWCEPWGKFIAWDKRRWQIEDRRQAEALAKRVADAIWRWVGDNLDALKHDERDEVLKFAKYTANARGIGNMLALARSEPGIAILPQQLDSHPYLLNAQNGTIDLRSGRLLAHDPTHLMTKITPIEYLQGPESECPIWEGTLDAIFRGDTELVGFFHRLCGSALPGEVVDHVLPVLYGIGSNGKSLATEVLLNVMGEYADKASDDLLLAKRGESHPTERADLFGLRLAIVNETEEGRWMAESATKAMTGGDTVKARRMREDFWSFKPSHLLMLVTNHRPRVRGQGHGLWRRLRLIPFTAKFWDASRGESGAPEMEADRMLKHKLQAEHGGILRWLVDGCREWQRVGLREPAAVMAATAEYKAAEDVFAQFIDEHCIVDKAHSVKASELRKRLAEWSKECGERAISDKKLSAYLSEVHEVTKRTSNGTVYVGIGLLESGRMEG